MKTHPRNKLKGFISFESIADQTLVSFLLDVFILPLILPC